MADNLSAIANANTGRYVLRIAWIAARLMLAYYLGHSDTFFYQGF